MYQDQMRETFDVTHKLKGGVSGDAHNGVVKLRKRDVTDKFITTTENYKQTQKNDQPKFQNQT
jgi:hypothetical protein